MAERRVRRAVQSKYWGPAEEDVTFLLRGELRIAVARASDDGAFREAFLADVVSACPGASDTWRLRTFATGLIATVNFHGRSHEGRNSASDIGIVVETPEVRIDSWDPTEVTGHNGVGRGILVQAKLGRPKAAAGGSYWGRLTRPQSKLFRQHPEGRALLLYQLMAPQGRRLGPFRWQLCVGYSARRIGGWLGQDKFPSVKGSSEVMAGLARGEFGSDSLARELTNPDEGPHRRIEFRVFWPDDEPGRPRRVSLVDKMTQHVIVRQLS